MFTVEYYLAIKNSEIRPFVATWMDLNIILSEVRQRKDEYHRYISLTLKKKQIQTQKTNMVIKGGGDKIGVWDQQIQTTTQNRQQGPTAQHRELYSVSCNNPQWKRI